jgi:hypothetical protein
MYKNAFTSRYNISKLVYYEMFTSIEDAIIREKQLKAGSRQKKVDLIYKMNPEWNDLYEGLLICSSFLVEGKKIIGMRAAHANHFSPRPIRAAIVSPANLQKR